MACRGRPIADGGFRLPRCGQRGTAGAAIPARLAFEGIVARATATRDALDGVDLDVAAGRDRLPARPFRLRQDDPAARRRRRRGADRRPRPARWPRGRGPNALRAAGASAASA